MISSEVFLEDEQLVYVVEDAVHERCKQVRLAVDIAHLNERLFTD